MAMTYKCPSCGASMAFDGEKGTLSCEYCGREQPVEEVEQSLNPEEYEALEPQTGKADGTFKVYRCASCGAEMLTDEHTSATICSFCGSPGLMEDRLTGQHKPSRVLPFQISRERAEDIFRRWTKKGLLTPGDFSSRNTLEKITGIYVPYWLYDYDTSVTLTAHCTRIRHQRKGDYEYTYTDHFQVYREVEGDYDGVPEDASEKMEDELMERAEPFDYSQMKPFEMPYLAGFLSEKYNYTSGQMAERAKKRVSEMAYGAARGTINGYATVNVTTQRIHLREKAVEYVLLPVWMLNYRYNGTNQQFLINGQSGKMVGTLPVSGGKTIAWFCGITAAVFLLLNLFLGL